MFASLQNLQSLFGPLTWCIDWAVPEKDTSSQQSFKYSLILSGNQNTGKRWEKYWKNTFLRSDCYVGLPLESQTTLAFNRKTRRKKTLGKPRHFLQNHLATVWMQPWRDSWRNRSFTKQIWTKIIHLGVSKNRGTQKWMVYTGNPY